MTKRKLFWKTDLGVPKVEHTRDATGRTVIAEEVAPPSNSKISFPRSARAERTFDFAPWYGAGIDAIIYACQRQIERFLAKLDADIEVSTVTSCCRIGLKHFFDFMILRSAALSRPLSLDDIDRETIDGYLGYLRESGVATTTQCTRYAMTKSVLVALARRGLIVLVARGDRATFPNNPFPNAHRATKGETALPRAKRKEFTRAVKTAVMPLLNSDDEPTVELVAYALLIVALHTGRNTTPLLELKLDCLRSHPKELTQFLVLYKRRGHNSSKVAVRAESTAKRTIELMPTVRPNVVQLIRRTIALTAQLRNEAPMDLKDRVWLYRARAGKTGGRVAALTEIGIARAAGKLVAEYQLNDSGGQPMRINVSRLRKTFANRIYELTDGDIATTAMAMGNTSRVTERSYLAPGEDSQKNWRFMGQCLVDELMSRTLGATERTPVGLCTDSQHGQYAPKQGGATCVSFLNCLRCRNYVVTGDDLYRLFSFYWRVLDERSRLPKARWYKDYAHIPRLIDRDVINEGLRRKIFRQAVVDQARARARSDPHPFWKAESLPSLEDFR